MNTTYERTITGLLLVPHLLFCVFTPKISAILKLVYTGLLLTSVLTVHSGCASQWRIPISKQVAVSGAGRLYLIRHRRHCSVGLKKGIIQMVNCAMFSVYIFQKT